MTKVDLFVGNVKKIHTLIHCYIAFYRVYVIRLLLGILSVCKKENGYYLIIVIWVSPVTYYVATKFEALAGRGGEDYRWSHDFEDIVYILNSCSYFVELYREESNAELRSYLKFKCMELLKRNNILEEIECVLPIGKEERVDEIMKIIQEITK